MRIYFKIIGMRINIGFFHSCNLWVELVFIVVEGVPVNAVSAFQFRFLTKMKLQSISLLSSLTSSSLWPAGIFSILVLHSQVFEEGIIGAWGLLAVLLHYNLAILQLKWFSLKLLLGFRGLFIKCHNTSTSYRIPWWWKLHRDILRASWCHRRQAWPHPTAWLLRPCWQSCCWRRMWRGC